MNAPVLTNRGVCFLPDRQNSVGAARGGRVATKCKDHRNDRFEIRVALIRNAGTPFLGIVGRASRQARKASSGAQSFV